MKLAEGGGSAGGGICDLADKELKQILKSKCLMSAYRLEVTFTAVTQCTAGAEVGGLLYFRVDCSVFTVCFSLHTCAYLKCLHRRILFNCS